MKGDRRLIYQAVAYSPLSAAVCSLREIQSMVDELFAVNEAVPAAGLCMSFDRKLRLACSRAPIPCARAERRLFCGQLHCGADVVNGVSRSVSRGYVS